jgi:hypothetical protein
VALVRLTVHRQPNLLAALSLTGAMVRELLNMARLAMAQGRGPVRNLARLSIPMLMSVAMNLDPASVRANGEPEKVVDGRYVVSLVLVPDRDAMRFRFAFRDFRTGKPLAGPIAYHVTIRDGHGGAVIYETPELVTASSAAEVRYRVPRDGFYETVLEFRHPAVGGSVYRPEDWYLWIPAGTDRGQGVPWTALAVLALVLACVWWWRTAVRRQRGGRSSP